jgi:glutamyl-Q tRNA(Asp) synthetase
MSTHQNQPPILRFAPSPNGYLHLGHAYSALLNQHMAHALNGQLLLRIEDIDQVRCRPYFEDAIYEDLRWLGVEWALPVRRQSLHFDLYHAAAKQLRGRGLLYPCFCSRRERTLHAQHSKCDPDGVGLYDGRCRAMNERECARFLTEGRAHVWRLDMARALAEVDGDLYWTSYDESGHSTRVKAQPDLWGDVVVVRRDIPTSYHLSVVIDDALQHISHVVRGQDLYHATHIHCLLQALLGLPSPLYYHHQLIRDEAGEKLSKSKSQPSSDHSHHPRLIRDARGQGMSAVEVRKLIGFDD